MAATDTMTGDVGVVARTVPAVAADAGTAVVRGSPGANDKTWDAAEECAAAGALEKEAPVADAAADTAIGRMSMADRSTVECERRPRSRTEPMLGEGDEARVRDMVGETARDSCGVGSAVSSCKG
jgi:hypothetical protein